MTTNKSDEIKNALYKVQNKLKNHIVKSSLSKYLQGTDLLDRFEAEIENKISTVNKIVEIESQEKLQAYIENLNIFLTNTESDTDITLYYVKIIDSMNFIIHYSFKYEAKGYENKNDYFIDKMAPKNATDEKKSLNKIDRLKLGKFRVKRDKIELFNDIFLDYGDDLVDMLFYFKSIDKKSDSAIFKILFYNNKTGFKDSISKEISTDKLESFEDLFEIVTCDNESEAINFIYQYLLNYGYPEEAIKINYKINSYDLDVTIWYDNQIIAIIEEKTTNRFTYPKLEIQTAHQLNSYYLSIQKIQKVNPKIFIVFSNDNIYNYYEYNLENNLISLLNVIPDYNSLIQTKEEHDIPLNNENNMKWDAFVKTIDTNKLNKIQKGVKNQDLEEGLRLRDFLNTLIIKLQKDIPELNRFNSKQNSSPTQPHWSPSNGFRVSFYKGTHSTKETQINITLWSNWGGGVFIKDNKKLLFDNAELKELLKTKYSLPYNEENLHITALSFKNKYPKYKEIINALKLLVTIYKIIEGTPNSNELRFKSQEQVFASFQNDNPESETAQDKLEIDKDVDAFAKLIAYKKLETPLSIGLFGKWGSGKSFFMKELEAKIKIYENYDESTFCKDVVHVKFNAWHYSDTNLWASLIYKIFSDIDNQKCKTIGEKQNHEKQTISKLYEELKSSKRKIQEKEVEQKTISKKISNLQETEQKQIEKLTNSKDEVKKLEAINYVKLVLTEPEVKEKIEGIKEKLEIDNELNFQVIQETYYNLKSITSIIKKAISLIYKNKNFLKIICYLSIPLTIIFGLGLYYLPDSWSIASISAYIVPAFWIVYSKIQTTIKPMMKNMNNVLQKWDEIENRKKNEQLEKLRIEREKQQLEFEKLKKIEEDLLKLNELKQATENEIEDIKSGKFFKNFISGKVSSSDYTKHLGLISLIRDDLTELEEYLLSEKGGKKYNVDRIVLYIDDLDRCSDELVVNVLEAVHLLLAFKLFVVVVGVDSRWIQGSLASRHKNFIDDKILITPKQYIEKIFQIPFKVKLMEKSDKKNLIRHLFDGNLDHNNFEKSDNNTNLSIQQKELKNLSEEEKVKNIKVEAKNSSVNDSEQILKLHEKLLLSQEEVEYIEETIDFIGETPRTIKRFANIYRVIRSHTDIYKILEDSFENYKLIVLLLCETLWIENVEISNSNDKSNFKEILSKELQNDYNVNSDLKEELNKFIKRFSFD